MKILIVTQVLDINHPILGFFHRWVEEFAGNVEQVHVIALGVGEYNLPPNVVVYSLGKEGGVSRIKYLWRFFKTIIKIRKDYGQVFVHMNQIYVILGFLVWKIFGKKIGLWYAHGSTSFSLRTAVFLADNIFTSTPVGLKIETKKKVIVGQGIDLDLFPLCQRELSSNPKFITDGRISRVKNLDVLIKVCAVLKSKKIQFKFRIVGSPVKSADIEYFAYLKKLAADLGLVENIIWEGGVNQKTLANLLKNADVYLHAGGTGSLDKSLVQAVCVGLPTFSSNEAYRELVIDKAPNYVFKTDNIDNLVDNIISLLDTKNLNNQGGFEEVISLFRDNYSLENLIDNILKVY